MDSNGNLANKRKKGVENETVNNKALEKQQKQNLLCPRRVALQGFTSMKPATEVKLLIVTKQKK